MSFPTIFCRNTILIILTSFSLNTSLLKFHFLTLCTFCWIASHICSKLVQIMESSFMLFYNETIVIQCYERNKHIILFLKNCTFDHKKNSSLRVAYLWVIATTRRPRLQNYSIYLYLLRTNILLFQSTKTKNEMHRWKVHIILYKMIYLGSGLH